MVKDLSVFFPCVNEEGNIENTVQKATRVLEKLNINYEIIIVNDGSSDNTGVVANRLTKGNRRIRVIHHPKNLGYGEALKSGLYNSRYDTIVYTDGDGQFDFAQVTRFLEKLDGVDLIIGYRIKRQDPIHRILFAKGWTLTLWTFFGLTLKDVDCGFKMIKRKALEKIPHLESQRGAMINAELAIKTKKAGFIIEQVGVDHFPRLKGKSTGANIKVILKSYLDLIRLWWKLKDEKKLFILLLLILGLASVLRFYRLENYMTFLGDEGRDAIVVKNMLTAFDLPLIGPPTSIGNIYLGPLYYYMMAIPMVIFWLNPVAAAGMNVLIGVLTIILIYILGKNWFGRIAALTASFLYTISPVTIIYSRSSWNPNPAPFFALLGIFGVYKVHTSANFSWFILTGIAMAAALQMHYLALILIPVFGVLWILETILYSKGRTVKNLWSGTLLGILSFLLIMSPLVWFDLRYNFLNYRAITELFANKEAIQPNAFLAVLKSIPIFTHKLIGRYIAGENTILVYALSILTIFPLGWLIKNLKKETSWPFTTLTVWLLIGMLGLSLYQQSIYDHYLGFVNPAPFLLLGWTVQFIFHLKNRLWGLILKLVLALLLVVLTIVNLDKNPLKYPPNNQLERTQAVANFIIRKSENKDFNFALIAKSNYDLAYQFYLDIYGYKPKQLPVDKTGQLFVVCEDPICDPTHNAKYEVAAFGWSRIDWMEDFKGVKIYRLISNPSGKP
ncbi:hypothetical protein A3H40_04225 [Candidatus Daviesbacteria bacterium RIFCSPLOWO2_02_FULL_38_15]|uniref:Glycosyltransferase 2-like domain-containing protein n=1 Tax=Candidatus Daviesbacteria bacterium RIFCSPLOWO2_02_FULL_38_15 TaxID=1797794 RepID=A0A1F5N4C1_9BACT|nr:MAG: hypothetical protein A3H40_04225 [Candidatus Daviesbacteria bacterium RIFCSPLOWO2_02_FULL_38_15]